MVRVTTKVPVILPGQAGCLSEVGGLGVQVEIGEEGRKLEV